MVTRHWIRVAVAVAGGIAASAAAAVAAGTLRWRRSTARAVERLAPGAPASGAAAFAREQLAGLPGPVVRYFEFALTPGRPLIRSARVEQTGEFRSGGFGAPWSRFTAVQRFSVAPPGFVWDATIRVAPLLAVRVRDSYVGGAAAMQGKLASLVTVVDQRGRPELDAGALHRYLAEAVWLPTALLPGQGVVWEAVDDSTARATLTDAGTSVSLEFRFGERGEIVRAYTAGRYREVQGAYLPTPWACAYRRYAAVGGVMVPMEGEVEWVLPEGRLSYWRGRIVDIEYGSGGSLCAGQGGGGGRNGCGSTWGTGSSR